MKTRITPFQILLLAITIGVALGIYLWIRPREEPTKYLEERLQQQNVPVASMKVLQESPLQIEIVVRSLSEGEKSMPEDAINMLLVRRESMLANQKGYRIDAITRVLLNKMGKRIITTIDYLDPEKVSAKLSRSTVSDAATEKAVRQKINLHGLSLVDAKVTSMAGIQTLNLKLSSSSIEEANRLLPQFLASLYSAVPDLNVKGSQIALCKVELRDQKGNILFNYVLDLQFGGEARWKADGITVDW